MSMKIVCAMAAIFAGSSMTTLHYSSAFVVHPTLLSPSLSTKSIGRLTSGGKICLEYIALNASPSSEVEAPTGLYRKFADHAWDKLQASGLFQDFEIPQELSQNEAPAKGAVDTIVKIFAKAMVPSSNDPTGSPVRYARVALLETVSAVSDEPVQSQGIQVLNFVVIPSESTSLPVLGIDLVTLPGNRHLLLLDAQPMTDPNPYDDLWQGWHERHVDGKDNFPWGGDFPEPVQKFVSKYALWTRLQEVDDPVSVINGDVWEAFVEHLDIYLLMLKQSQNAESQGRNHQPAYLNYRRTNDPAKPMLNSLYGSEWTDRLLDEVLFPK